MRRRGFLPCLAGAAVAGCGRKGRQSHRLRVAFIPRFTLAPIYLAAELGSFRQAGLEVEFIHIHQSALMPTLLAGGQIQVAMSSPTPAFINAVLKGARMRIVAARDTTTPGCANSGAIFGNRRAFPSGLRDLRALKGKRVAIHNQTGLVAFSLDQLLASAGMTRNDINPVIMGVAEAAAAVAAGKLDAVAAAELDKNLDLVSAEIVRSITLEEVLPNHQFTFVIFGADLLEGNPEAGIGFLWAYLHGVREYRAGKTPRALEELARAARHDLAAVRAACRESISREGRPDRASIQRFVDWAAGKGYLLRTVNASELIDTRFVEEANRRLEQHTVP